MKKKYIAYLLLGGAVYYYIVNQNRKDKLKELELKTLSPIPQKKNIVNVVKKILPVVKKSTNKQQDMFFQQSIFNKNLLDYVKTKPSAKKEIYNFPFLKPKSINGSMSFPDMC
jgi:hypothetical protein